MASFDLSYIASGFQEDCTQLKETFKSHESLSFAAFCKAWEGMKFSLVFLYRKTYAEILEFCEEALNIAKQFLLSSSELIEQVFGLYLLYGLYYKIPIENVKIRVTLNEWQKFLNLREQIKEEKLYDASYIFVKLVTEDAFYHCLFSTEYGLEKVFKLHHDVSSDDPYSMLPNIIEDVEVGEIAKLQEISKIYDEQKTKLLSSSSNSKLQLFDKNLLTKTIAELETFQGRTYLPIKSKKKFKEAINSSNRIDKFKYGDKIRPKLGHGFDTDSSDDEDQDMDLDDIKTDDHHENGSKSFISSHNNSDDFQMTSLQSCSSEEDNSNLDFKHSET